MNERCISYKNSLKMVDTMEDADLSAPTTMKQLRSLLHFVGYYRRTRQEYALITAPLKELLRKAISLRRDAECQGSFKLVKKKIGPLKTQMECWLDHSAQRRPIERTQAHWEHRCVLSAPKL